MTEPDLYASVSAQEWPAILLQVATDLTETACRLSSNGTVEMTSADPFGGSYSNLYEYSADHADSRTRARLVQSQSTFVGFTRIVISDRARYLHAEVRYNPKGIGLETRTQLSDTGEARIDGARVPGVALRAARGADGDGGAGEQDGASGGFHRRGGSIVGRGRAMCSPGERCVQEFCGGAPGCGKGDDVMERPSAKPGEIIVDPAYQGMAGGAAKALADLFSLPNGPKRLAYVSCNPKSFARDAKELAAAGLTLESISPVDLFPSAMHLELVAAFS